MASASCEGAVQAATSAVSQSVCSGAASYSATLTASIVFAGLGTLALGGLLAWRGIVGWAAPRDGPAADTPQAEGASKAAVSGAARGWVHTWWFWAAAGFAALVLLVSVLVWIGSAWAAGATQAACCQACTAHAVAGADPADAQHCSSACVGVV